jgi:hypothetical protein
MLCPDLESPDRCANLAPQQAAFDRHCNPDEEARPDSDAEAGRT